MSSQTEFNGDACIVLPSDYLKSPKAAAEIYEDELTLVASNLDIDNLGTAPGFFHGTLFATLIWTIPSVWSVCL